ncbi:uncharacterized protein METZ01_LOCUS107050 [marine metagenome]|uniref:Uncharacterized protein n=1 Tax=marine metagenome TaxID=408172 RepID=A0A381WNU4_9ZZZZ
MTLALASLINSPLATSAKGTCKSCSNKIVLVLLMDMGLLSFVSDGKG